MNQTSRRNSSTCFSWFVFVLLGAGCTLGPVGSGRLVTESRPFSSFQAIEVRDDLDVQLAQGPGSIDVIADDNLISEITTEVVDGTLVIARRRTGPSLVILFGSTHTSEVHVSIPGGVSAVRLSGSGTLTSNDPAVISGEALSLEVSGSGSVTLASKSASTTASVTGSGDLVLSGTGAQGDFTVGGSGGLDASRLVLARARATVSGSGDLAVNATQSLDAQVSGSGSITYQGTATLTRHVTGSGSINGPR